MTSSDQDEDPERADPEAVPPADRRHETEPASAGGAPKGLHVPHECVLPHHEWHRVDLDEETQLHLRLWSLGGDGVWARALVVQGTTPPFVAAHEELPHGLRFVARPHGTPAPVQERAVRVELFHGGHPRIGVEEVWRAPGLLGDGGAG